MRTRAPPTIINKHYLLQKMQDAPVSCHLIMHMLPQSTAALAHRCFYASSKHWCGNTS